MKYAKGFTLVECVISLLILVMVLFPVFGAFDTAWQIESRTRTIYEAGALLEGVVALARQVTNDDLSKFETDGANDINLLLEGVSTNHYALLLVIENAKTSERRVFTSEDFTGDLNAAFSFAFSKAMTNADLNAKYDFVAENDAPTITVNVADSESFHIALRGGGTTDIINTGEGTVYADIYGDCEITYQGGGAFMQTKLCEISAYYIYAAAYKNDEIILQMTAYQAEGL